MIYGRVAQNLGFGEGLTYQGLAATANKTLYPFVIAPAWALAEGQLAYDLALAINGLLMPLAALPAYAIARRVAPFAWAVVAALASALTPAMAWSSMLMTEALAYPLAALALWAAVRALERPGAATGAVALLAALLAGTARTQMLAMLPVLALAVVLDVMRCGRGWRARARAHRWSLAAIGIGLLAGAAVLVGPRGGLLGTYAGEVGRGTRLAEVLGLLPEYLPILAVSTLIAPLLALVALATSPRRWRDPQLGPVLAVAVAATAVFLLVGAWASATLSSDLHERYVFYPAAILPVLWVALGTRHERARVALAAVALFAMFLPVFSGLFGGGSSEWIRYTVGNVLQARGLVVPPWLGGDLQLWLVATAGIAVATLLGLFLRRGPLAIAAFALPPLVFGLGVVSAREHDLRVQSIVFAKTHTSPPDLVDRIATGPAAFVRTPGSSLTDVWYLELWNRRLERVWRLPTLEAESSIGQACPLEAAPGGALRAREPCAGRGLPRFLVFSDPAYEVRVRGGRRLAVAGATTVWERPPGPTVRLALTPPNA